MNLPSSLLRRNEVLSLQQFRPVDDAGHCEQCECISTKDVYTTGQTPAKGPPPRIRTPSNTAIAWSSIRAIAWPAVISFISASAGFVYGSSNGSRQTLLTLEHKNIPRSQPPEERQGSAPSCGGSGTGDASYDLPLHVGALIIVLFVSSTACAFPMLALKFRQLRIPPVFLFVVQHFGTGVLLATAFVHLLPTAFQSLNDPCLSSFWTVDYPAMPGAIALAAIFLVTLAEMIFSKGRHSHQVPVNALNGEAHRIETRPVPNEDVQHSAAHERGAFASRGALYGRSTSVGRGLTEAGEGTVEQSPADREDSTGSGEAFKSQTSHPDQEFKKAILQCTMLEMGILFHSIFIGMALSVTLGTDFVILLIAIVFHQTCEGLALGARIAHIPWTKGAKQPWLMAVAYGCTTPLGQAIGLSVHRLYDPDSQVGLLVVGIFNALSAGLLCFSSLVELLSEDFLSDESWKILHGRRRAVAFALVFAGAFAMSLIGGWA
ncbi:hypothetical protein D0869_05239 [Hortaea werneckii]|uniref:Uncharacterized protein n=1 Tax=Hortaea werneckii TaxID=91943 RepID=A0A3M6WY60_HORWE|nr:hypothetical protein D0869_05239 [Hortaea werneckii]RMY10637.1 hypothetical protein D0868_03586 [Hortaea werneckii]